MGNLHLKSPKEIEQMRKGGAILASILNDLTIAASVDMPTLELDKLAKDLCKKHNVRSGTLGYHGYPAAVSVSINEELVHGIPSKFVIIKDGDVVKIDMVIIYDGFYLDSAKTRIIGTSSDLSERLVGITKLALEESIKQCVVGQRTGDVSNKMQSIIETAGFNVVRQMAGHGVGKQMHEEPELLCYGKKGTGAILREGMTIAVEPMSMAGNFEIEIDDLDGWTARTIDGSLTAHFEHTVAITAKGPKILTKE